MNGNVVNMFAARKVKLHGMKSSKWTTKDKINQYKGLINLYTRDRKIIEMDTNVTRKKMQRELKDMQKSVYNDRRALDNAIRGDKQKLRNTLAEHKRLQMAYQNSQPKVVIEEIDQLNFNRRKVLDKLKYDKKLKSQTLSNLKLEQALLEDRLKYAFLGQIKQEKEAQIITGRVQDAILRKEAAWAIHHIYREIIDIMKKDALYFDVIIATVKNDGFSQSKCFLGATKLGQLATEYLDDRRQEFDTLEKIILKDMATRKVDIRVLSEQLENAAINIKMLLRKDSDMTTCLVKVGETPSFDRLRNDVDQIERTLQFLKDTTLVPSYEAIYPCLEEQLKQKLRLCHLVKKCERDRDIMQNKTNHAQLMCAVLKSSMNETTNEYKTRKKELVATLDDLIEKKQYYEKAIKHKREIAATIKIKVTRLFQRCYGLKGAESEDEKKRSSTPYTQPKINHNVVQEPLPSEPDAKKMLLAIISKFSALMAAYYSKHKENKIDDAYRFFEAMMQERMIRVDDAERQLSQESLLQGLFTETSQQLTREEIKKQSAEIVAANTHNEDLIPSFGVPSKRKKFKPSSNAAKSSKH